MWSRLVRGSKYLLAARQMPKKSSIVISSRVSSLTENCPKMNLPASTATEKIVITVTMTCTRVDEAL